MCPANPENIERRVVLSEDYHDKKVTIDFYTNSAIAIYRGEEDNPDTDRVWLDNLEKHALFEALSEDVDQESGGR